MIIKDEMIEGDENFKDRFNKCGYDYYNLIANFCYYHNSFFMRIEIY